MMWLLDISFALFKLPSFIFLVSDFCLCQTPACQGGVCGQIGGICSEENQAIANPKGHGLGGSSGRECERFCFPFGRIDEILEIF